MKIQITIVMIMLCISSGIFAQTATAPDSGDGTIGNPYQIATLENLYWIAVDNTRWDYYYKQTADINASETYGWSGGGWTPIGNNAVFFRGTYNGQHYCIDSLYISRTDNDIYYQGLFGYTYASTIQNVYVTHANISGNNYTGALIGRSGYNTTLNGGTISDCYSSGYVNANGAYVGGLVGICYKSTIERCYSTCDVGGSANVLHSGGLIGRTEGVATVNNCYSRGSVSANGDIGGLIGSNNGATITNCYSSGSVFAWWIPKGGFIGSNSAGTVSNCFWDTQTSGQASSAAGTGKTTSEMKTESTFTNAGWDFTSTWEIVGTNYPRLLTNPETALPVEMTAFKANAIQNVVTIRWQTMTEENNFGFEIERCDQSDRQLQGDGHLPWEKIGFVEGHGTSNVPREYSLTDKYLIAGKYSYRVKQIDRDGKFKYSQSVEVTIGQTSALFELSQNYPNPFNPSTTIGFTLAAAAGGQSSGMTTLKIYDAIGREVVTLVNEHLEAGVYHQRTFDASLLASGMYFARLQNNGRQMMRKMLFVK